jgi:hypothetical protein
MSGSWVGPTLFSSLFSSAAEKRKSEDEDKDLEEGITESEI